MSEWPTVPDERLEAGGWELVDRTTETVFRLSKAEVVGRTLLYEDPALRERVGADAVTRFFFATALSFRPSLPPGAERLIEPTVTDRAHEGFADRLRSRGFEGLTRRDQGRLRTDGGATASLSNVRAACPIDGERLDVTGWLAVWRADGFRIAGGGYPEGFEEGYRDELLELVRGVA